MTSTMADLPVENAVNPHGEESMRQKERKERSLVQWSDQQNIRQYVLQSVSRKLWDIVCKYYLWSKTVVEVPQLQLSHSGVRFVYVHRSSRTCPLLPLLGFEVLLNDFYSTSQEQICIFASAFTIRPLNWESSGWKRISTRKVYFSPSRDRWRGEEPS